jgi:flagellar biosynthetic protein FliQ
VVSILQAATQVNEQTLTFVPKIVLSLGVFALLFPWIMTTLVEFARRLLVDVATRGGP